jgi:hypothetical protein
VFTSGKPRAADPRGSPVGRPRWGGVGRCECKLARAGGLGLSLTGGCLPFPRGHSLAPCPCGRSGSRGWRGHGNSGGSRRHLGRRPLPHRRRWRRCTLGERWRGCTLGERWRRGGTLPRRRGLLPRLSLLGGRLLPARLLRMLPWRRPSRWGWRCRPSRRWGWRGRPSRWGWRSVRLPAGRGRCLATRQGALLLPGALAGRGWRGRALRALGLGRNVGCGCQGGHLLPSLMCVSAAPSGCLERARWAGHQR